MLASGIPSPVTVPSSALPAVLILLPTLLAMPVVPDALLDSSEKLLLAEAPGLLCMAPWLLESSVKLLLAEAPGLLCMAAWLLESSVKLLLAAAPGLLLMSAWLLNSAV